MFACRDESFNCNESENSSSTLNPIGGGTILLVVLFGIIGGGWLGFSKAIEIDCDWLFWLLCAVTKNNWFKEFLA